MLLRRSMSVRPSAIRRSSSTERISEPSCSFWLRFCAVLVIVELALHPVGGAMEQVDGRPEQVGEVRFEARVLQRRDQRIEDIGHGAADGLGFGQWPRVGLVLEGTVAMELRAR